MPDSKKTNTSLLRPPPPHKSPTAPRLSHLAQWGGNGRWGHIPPTASPAPSTRCRCWKPVHKVPPRQHQGPAPLHPPQLLFPEPNHITEYTK